MTFHALPFEPREIRATEARLEAIYDAARLGLRGDNLALAAGLLPVEFRRLAEFDPLVEMAAAKGRADSEQAAALTIDAAIRSGDAKMALEVLRHRHDWVAKQSIDVNIDERISVISALERAERRAVAYLAADDTQIIDDATFEVVDANAEV